MSEEIAFYQELSTITWPPKMILNLNGWKLRISEGVTKRANSVSPTLYTGNDLNADIARVERFFQEKGLPAIFQLPDYFEPSELRNILLSSGYKVIDETIVMIGDISVLKLPSIATDFDLHHFEGDIERWISAFRTLRESSKSLIEGFRDIIERATKSNVCYYLAEKENKAVAVGLTISEGNYMGIYNMFTHQDYRRQGVAQALISMIIEWGEINLIDHVFLQVEADNLGAIQLYKKIGFKEKYSYRYLIKSF